VIGGAHWRGRRHARWVPPFVAGKDGAHLGAAYFHATNRGKRSIELDFESERGRRIVRKLAARSDVLIENFKVSGLAKFGLDYASLREECPRLIYCSVTGFGQDGPYAARAGYDLMAQGMGGFMDLTGTDAGEPTRAGVPVSDIFTGVYSVVGILAALTQRERTGRGCRRRRACRFHGRGAREPGAQLLVSAVPHGSASAHPNIVPYQVFPAADGHLIVATGNDRQFQKFCSAVGEGKLADDPAYLTNKDRLARRDELIAKLGAATARMKRDDLLDKLEAVQVPAGPINTLAQVFSDPQVKHRGLRLQLKSDAAANGTIPGVRTPIVIGGAPMARNAPLLRSASTPEILREIGGS
jgi:crotonobetainyl-CoA:carnitine CoA-transferase CaiB-like acyl-CoA transferase